jgi:hypothetical protein
MRALRILLVGLMAAAGSLAMSSPALAARTGKAPAQIMSITAARYATHLDIVVRTTSVPASYRITENIYLYDVSGTLVDRCGTFASLHSGAGTGTSSTNPYVVPLPEDAKAVKVVVTLSQVQVKRAPVVVDTVDSGKVSIPDLPAGYESTGLNIWLKS